MRRGGSASTRRRPCLSSPDGHGSVVGPGAAWFVRMGAADIRRCVAGEPLVTDRLDVLAVSRGDTVDLPAWTRTGAQHTVRARDGALVWDT